MKGKAQGFIHRYIPAADPHAATLLLLHGTGGDEQSLLALGRQCAPDAALLSPRGKVLEDGHHARFFRRCVGGVLDQEDLFFRTHELADWIEMALSDYGIAPESLVTVGYSNGANVAANILLQRPGMLRRCVLLRAMLLNMPMKAPNLTGTDVLIAAGTQDTVLPLHEAEHLAQTLDRYGANVTLQKQPADHHLVSADTVLVQDWLEQHSPLAA